MKVNYAKIKGRIYIDVYDLISSFYECSAASKDIHVTYTISELISHMKKNVEEAEKDFEQKE